MVAGVCVALTGCGAVKRTVLGAPKDGPEVVSGFIGGVVADEPRAALAAKEVLALGGNAADAATTLGLMLSVTLPSRASLASGGACIAYQPGEDSPNHGVPEAVMFLPAAPAVVAGDRPAAVPMLARGLYLLSARYGTRNFAQAVAPAEAAARFGFQISRALANDLTQVAHPFTADPAAGAIFAPGGVALGEGGKLVQLELAATLTQLRTVGVGDMYTGLLAHKLAEVTAAAGGPVSVDDLRRARATLAPPFTETAGNDQIAWLPQPADGGIAAAAALDVLQHDPSGGQAAADAALATAAKARGAALPALPASTSFLVIDGKGGAVACALTMNNLFGTGRVAPGTGIVLAASPAVKPAPLLTAGIAWNANLHAFHAAVGGTGQNAAAIAAAYAMSQALAGAPLTATPEPGRANVIACTRYLPGESDSCHFTSDPRGAGLGITGG